MLLLFRPRMKRFSAFDRSYMATSATRPSRAFTCAPSPTLSLCCRWHVSLAARRSARARCAGLLFTAFASACRARISCRRGACCDRQASSDCSRRARVCCRSAFHRKPSARLNMGPSARPPSAGVSARPPPALLLAASSTTSAQRRGLSTLQ